MNVGKAIYYLLANNANVSAITTRIYPEFAPPDATTPFIAYTISNVQPDDTHDGPAEIDEVRMDVICVDDTYDGAADLASVVRVALDRVYGTYNTVNVESIQFTDANIEVRDTPRQYGQDLTFIVRVKRDDVQIATGSPIEDVTLGRLADVDTTGATDDQVLTYDAASGTWGPEDASTVAALNDLTDVTITTPANNQALVYNEAAGEWRNDQLGLTQLEGIDSNLGDAIDRQALVFDEASNQWIADGVGQVVIPVRNPSRDDSIAIGTVLKATGAQGDRILVAPFEPTDDPKYLIGVASEALGTNADGHAQVYGELRGIDTDAFTVGTVLYAGASGALTATAGDYPIAIVTRKHQNTGRIFIRTWKLGTSRYDDQVEELRAEMETSLANADIELMFSAQADGFGVAYSPESDSVVNSTPAEDYQVERAIFYNNTGLASYASDSGWSTLTTNTESYAAAKARVEDYIRGGTYGKLPCTFAIVRTEEPVRTGLLVDYPGAAAAYSLRLLDTDYTGSAVRVRRASDNAEQDIGFDAGGDLDTTSLATFCSGTDGFVKTWYDQSGNSNDATQTTTANQPQIVSSGSVITENGKPALDFAAISHFDLVNYINPTANTTYTLSGVARPDVNDNLMVNLTDGTELMSWAYGRTAGNLTARTFDGATVSDTSGAIAINTQFVGFSIHDFTSVSTSLYINGGAATGTNAGRGDIAQSTIGDGPLSSLQFDGAWQEIVLWGSDQSSNRTGIESNINTYYSIYP